MDGMQMWSAVHILSMLIRAKGAFGCASKQREVVCIQLWRCVESKPVTAMHLERLPDPAPLSLCKPSEARDRSLLDRSGAFVWWYLDALDETKSGLVLIWSYGLPFLPQASRAPKAKELPSLNIALYENGRPTFYLLQTYEQERALYSRRGWRFGDTRIARTYRDGKQRLDIDLSCEVPRGPDPLQGQLAVVGPLAQLDPTDQDGGGVHRWSPLMGPAVVKGALRCGQRRWEISAPAYHDHNTSSAPLGGLNIDRWTWGRVVTRDRTLIYYAVWPKRGAPIVYGLRINADGRCERWQEPQLELMRSARALYGVRYASHLELHEQGRRVMSARTERIVDNGPFYLRTIERFELDGEEHFGIAEWVRPDRVHSGLFRPFVNMRVHTSQGPNSMLLPLFTGPEQGRFQRLVGLAR